MIKSEAALGICASEDSISADEYHKLPGVSNSRLQDFMADPRVYHYKYLSGQYVAESKDEFDFGQAVHDLCLLGEDAGFMAIPSDVLASDGSRKGNKWKEFAEANAGKILLKQSAYRAVLDCVNSVLDHPVASRLLLSEGVSEKLFGYDDPVTGLTLRCRPDRLVTFNGVIVVPDLKTTQDTTAKQFAKSIANFGYHYQAYFYSKVLKACGVDVKAFVFVAVRVSKPHTVDVYTLDDDFMRKAEIDVENSLADLAERTRSNDWNPRSFGSIVKLSPPGFLKFQGEYAL